MDRSFEGQPLSKASRKLRSAVSSLQGYDRAIYNYIAGQLPQIAAGEQASTEFEITTEIMGLEKDSWTAEELGVDAVIAKDENGNYIVPADAQEAAFAKVAINLSRILDVLLAEHPYELYWYDKTTNAGTKMTSFGLKAGYDKTLGTYVLGTNGNMYLRFSVAQEYSAGEYLVDTSIGRSVQSAVDNANAIVSEYSGISDEEKLRGYKDEICGLVSYNSLMETPVLMLSVRDMLRRSSISVTILCSTVVLNAFLQAEIWSEAVEASLTCGMSSRWTTEITILWM